MKITRNEFLTEFYRQLKELKLKAGGMFTQEANLNFNCFNSRLGTVYRCKVKDKIFYYCCGLPGLGAYDKMSTLRAQISKNLM
jgi:hypothetical protein